MRLQSSKPKRAGLTILELMVAMGLSSILLLTLMMLASYSARSFLAIGNYVALDRASRAALDELTLKIREADGVINCATNRVELSYHGKSLVYAFDPETRTVNKIWDGNTTKLLDGCDDFRLMPFQRNPIGGTYDQYPVATEMDVAKIVQISWLCSRKALGGLVNSESVQSAKIVIRKQ
jgi:hypothetical protein